MEDNTIFKTELVSNIKGTFYIESYQRGYRWEKGEVQTLLDDIYENGERNRNQNRNNKYCIQPIVVKKVNDRYELIDGQQRLTTIYLIYKYLHEKMPEDAHEPNFSIEYRKDNNKTEENIRDFLVNIDFSRKNENIDFYFLANAYEAINEWFSNEENKKSKTWFYEYLNKDVKIIWYEVDSSVNSNMLFTRLNIGKIPLTSSELVKAMFLSKDGNEQIDSEKQHEIALQWDNMERELNNSKFWYFLTNNLEKDYPTKIDLILDLITRKPDNSKNKYYTFDKLRKEEKIENVWKEIYSTFLILKDWFEDHELYHKIGYLIVSRTLKLQDIYILSKDKTKNEFKNELNKAIKESVANCDYAECDYNNGSENIKKLLILYNIETVRKHGEETQWFPFDKFKIYNNENNVWSLEHIHAQHSKTMKKESCKEWLKLHLKSLKSVSKNTKEDIELIEEVEKWMDNPQIDGSQFEKLRERVVEKLTITTKYSKHSLANLALLNFRDNSALNNSTFDVKRDKIIQMDKNGEYIPFCTRMVFLKYYTNSEDNQIHFWGQRDMEEYINNMNYVLKEYLDKEIKLDMEETPINE